ncbi:hypothetical protein DPMN_176657 [Dreissena polymorpha]|uniref:Uncharacterized protein n=1 Tax=Dreissena polymorpha TaxID=45954 RepID=A0A9D4EAK4_DREPO|nr:hypothetical protein DPMN_176657 [Dreissena polymorpha]
MAVTCTTGILIDAVDSINTTDNNNPHHLHHRRRHRHQPSSVSAKQPLTPALTLAALSPSDTNIYVNSTTTVISISMS